MNQIFWQHLKSMLALSSLVLLGACSSTTEQPAPKFMGLLEVHIQGIGEGGTATASARFVDPSSLGQTSRGATVKPINGTAAANDVQFIRRQVSFSDDELNARRLVTGRFELINRSSTAFNNLTLYAVNIPGTTLGGTGIANMFDATGAAITDVNKARAFEPAHGTRPLDFSTVTDSNTADLQFFTPAEVNNPSNGIQQQAFAQSIIPNTATVLEYGFVARNLAQGRSIAARDTPTNCTISACHGQITLAYNLPKITPRNLNPWAFNLYFVAADESTATVSQSLEEQTANTAAGAVNTAAFNDVRVLAGSNLFDEKNLNQLCRVRTAVGPDAFLGRDPIPNSSGSLDVCFGANGRLRTATDTSNFIQDVTIQSDGKIVAVGTGSNGQDFLLVRYNPNSSLDTTFGNGGKVITDFTGLQDVPSSVKIQNDGKIVVTGAATVNNILRFAVARYNPDGSPDAGFGVFGLNTVLVGTECAGKALGIQSDGKIVIGGVARVNSLFDFALARFNTNGSLDTTFGTSGIVITDLGGADDRIIAMKIQSDDKIVVGGYSGSNVLHSFAMTRYNPNGSIDSNFGSLGTVQSSYFDAFSTPQDAKVTALALQTDDKIILSGNVTTSPNPIQFGSYLERYNTDGTLDTTFSGGRVNTNLNSRVPTFTTGLGVQTNGQIVVSKLKNVTSNFFTISVKRFSTFGVIDSTFGVSGESLVTFNTINTYLSSLAFQTDGKIVVAGGDESGKFVLARLNP